MFRTLADKAQDRSAESRGELLEQLTAAVLESGEAGPRELELYFEIVVRLFTQVSINARVTFAEHARRAEAIPLELLLMAANDVLDVAGPILREAKGFDEPTLVKLCDSLPKGHLPELARRERLTVKVTDSLVRRGDIAVLRRLALNISSELSRASMKRMVTVSQEDDDLCRNLSSRSDLPPEDADVIIQRMATLLRERMPRRLPPVVAVVEPEPPAPSPTRGKVPKKADIGELIAQVQAKVVTLDDVVAQLAEEDRTNDIAVAFARLCDLDEMAIMKVLVRKDVNGISMVAKALDLSQMTWDALVEFRRRRLKLSDIEIRFEKGDYGKRSKEACRATLAQFQNKRARSAG